MKTLLTGASGAIGRELIRECPEIVPIKVRPNSVEDLRREIADADFLIHAGAYLGSDSFERCITENVVSTIQILELVKELNPNLKIIFVSSMSIFGYDGKVKAFSQMSAYTISKFFAEIITGNYSAAVSVKFSTIFYKDPSRDGLSKIIYGAKTKGEVFIRPAARDFIPLNEVAAQLLKICDHEIFLDLPPQIERGTGCIINTRAVGEHLSKKYGTKVTYGEPDTSDVYCSFIPCRSELEWPFQNYYYEEIDRYYESI